MVVSSPVLIGRDDLLALAGRRLAEARDGAGELLFMAGEAGIGKTRLLGEIVRRARAAGYTVFGVGASPGDTEVAAGLLTDLGGELRRVAATAAVGERIARRLGEYADGDAGRQRRLLVADLAELLERAVDAPTLIALEDLHWADDLTLDVLGRLGRRASSLPLLMVGTFRSDELYPRVPMRVWRTRLLTQRYAEEVRLGRLNRDDTAALALAITGAALPGAALGSIFVRSDGIPLHVEEFLATVDGVPDTLADAVVGRAAQLTPAARALAEVASVLGRSFDLDLLTAITGDGPAVVDEGLRELTERFFVQPHPDRSRYDFRHALIRDALYGGMAPHRRRELHAQAAAAAVAAGFPAAFISDQYERASLFDQAFRYARSAGREAAAISAHREAAELYRRARRTCPATLPAGDRADLLLGLAAELAAIDDNEAAAECYAEAHRLWLELGDGLAAASLVPNWVAVRHLLGDGLAERTAALRAALPLAAAPGGRSVRADVHAALAAAYMLDRRLSEAIEDGELARSLAGQDGDRAMRCNLDATLGSVFLFAGRMAEGLELLRGSIERAARWRLEAPAARGYRMLGTSASVLVEYDVAARWLHEGIGYAERVEQFNDRHYMAAHLGHVRWATGDWTGAEIDARRALSDGGGITTRITALHVLGYVALGRGALDDAEALLSEAASLGGGMRELQRVSPAWWGLAEVALRRGETAASIDWCDQGYAASARVRDAAYLFPYVVTGTRARLAGPGATDARAWLARTSELLLERGIPGTLGAIEHGWGLVHLHEGRTGKAREALAAAARFWAGRRRFWEGAAALVDQARCARRSRRPADAARFSADARDAYAQVGALVPDDVSPSPAVPPGPAGAGAPAVPSSPAGRSLPGASPVPPGASPVASGAPVSQGDSLSRGQSAAWQPPAAARPALSPRELEVARLVAAGLTNREIATKLIIAPKTAAAHVEHIRTKLGVSRRAQIAAWVAARG